MTAAAVATCPCILIAYYVFLMLNKLSFNRKIRLQIVTLAVSTPLQTTYSFVAIKYFLRNFHEIHRLLENRSHFFKDILSFCAYWNFTSYLLWILFRYSGVLLIMTTQLFLNSLLFTTQLFKMEQIHVILFNCIVWSWFLNVQCNQ